MLVARTGIRESEALSILVRNILWEEGTIIIRAEKKKGEVYRRVAVDQKTLELTRYYLNYREETSPYLFPGQKPNTYLSRTWAYWTVRGAAERVGVTSLGDPLLGGHRAGDKMHKGHHVGVHSLRHSFALLWLEKVGGDMESIRKLQMQLGHQNPGTTMGYLSYSATELHNKYDKLFEETGREGKQ